MVSKVTIKTSFYVTSTKQRGDVIFVWFVYSTVQALIYSSNHVLSLLSRRIPISLQVCKMRCMDHGRFCQSRKSYICLSGLSPSESKTQIETFVCIIAIVQIELKRTDNCHCIILPYPKHNKWDQIHCLMLHITSTSCP